MADELRFDALEPWLAACLSLGVGAVVLREVDEVRATGGDHGVTVGPVRRARLLAYVKGRLLSLDLDAPPADLKARLVGSGLRVRQVRDHIG